MSHISFSELKAWDQCSYYHKLTYLDKIRLFSGNEYTAFGKAIHEVYEHSANCLKEGKDSGDLVKRFKQGFLDELLDLKKNLLMILKFKEKFLHLCLLVL
jgi:CRISPR/Cas system-associated exonuclease Cas4 (RecB family)